MSIDRKETVGKLSRDLLLKNDTPLHTPQEQTNEQLSEYEQNIFKCINDNKNKYSEDFFIVVLTKKEKLMQNVIRNYFFARESCPTPDYDQIVYKYHKKEDKIEFIWVIPDRQTSIYMKKNSHAIDPSQWKLLSFVLKFADGSLFKLSKALNNEKLETPELKEN